MLAVRTYLRVPHAKVEDVRDTESGGVSDGMGCYCGYVARWYLVGVFLASCQSNQLLEAGVGHDLNLLLTRSQVLLLCLLARL